MSYYFYFYNGIYHDYLQDYDKALSYFSMGFLESKKENLEEPSALFRRTLNYKEVENIEDEMSI